MPLQTGEFVLDRYRIIHKLGQGGFGAVYHAWDTRLERDVALKINLVETDEARRQFEKEARYLAGLRHPNLPQVLDFFILPNQEQYLVMEFVDGEDLAEMVFADKRPLPMDRALAWVDEICDALTYLHTRSTPVIHRDIKPSNIRIDSSGHAFLVDFGIAKAYDPLKSTTVGAKAVTPGYSAPEQYGTQPTDAQSDIYSLGATLYTLLTGQIPPESIDILIKRSPPQPAHLINPALPAAIGRVIEDAMQVEKERRIKTAFELRAELKTAAVSQVQVAPKPITVMPTERAPERTPSARLPIESNRKLATPTRLWSLTGVIVAILAGLVIWRSIAGDHTIEAAVTFSATPSIAATSTSQNFVAAPPPTRSPTATPAVILQPAVTVGVVKAPTPTPTPSNPQGTIAFHSDRGGNLDIYLIRADGTGLRRMTDYSGKDSFPSWSPDGSMLAYQSIRNNNSEIFLMDVESGESYQLTENLCSDWAPSFSPDGKELAFYSECDGNREIYVMPVEGGEPRQLTDTTGKYSWYPFWSSDGQWIYYTTNATGGYWVTRMDPFGAFQTPLVAGCSGVPSPLGGRLVYQDTCDDPWKLFISNDDGTDPELLIGGEDVIYGDPFWAPDEKWIVFSSNLGGEKDLYILNLLTEELLPLTKGGGNDAGPNWTARKW